MERRTELKVRSWILAVGYLVLIFGVSSIPQGAMHRPCVKISDKLAHFAEYAGFGLLLTVALRRTLPRLKHIILMVAVVAVGWVVGLLDETYQLTVPGREAELLDWTADAAGVVIGYVIARAFYLRAGRGGADGALAP